MKAKAIVLRGHGGIEMLQIQDIDLAPPAAGEVRLRHTAIAVNFHDCYVRSGLYQTLALPGIPGLEAVGVVEAVGEGVVDLRPGDRVGWVTPSYGGYATHRNLPAALALPLPDRISDAQAAASMVKAFTAHILVQTSHAVKSGQMILVHAAAGGVGQMLTRWCKHLGAIVIGTVGDAQKAETAGKMGADHVILYREEDFVARVREISSGNGVSAVYDAVGADTFAGSLSCLAYGGTLVSYGQSSGAVAPVRLPDLAEKSLVLTRPIIFHFIRTREQLECVAAAAFSALEQRFIKPINPLVLPLEQAGKAHALMESRQSPGGIVLVP